MSKSELLGKLHISTGGGYIYLWRYVVVNGEQTDIRQHIATISKDKITWDQAQEVALRIVECVNALENVHNPKLFMEYHEQTINDFFKIQADVMEMNKNKPIDPSTELRVYPTLKPTNNLTQDN